MFIRLGVGVECSHKHSSTFFFHLHLHLSLSLSLTLTHAHAHIYATSLTYIYVSLQWKCAGNREKGKNPRLASIKNHYPKLRKRVAPNTFVSILTLTQEAIEYKQLGRRECVCTCACGGEREWVEQMRVNERGSACASVREAERARAAEKTILANIYESFFVFQLSLVEKPFHLYLLIIFFRNARSHVEGETRKFELSFCF